MKTEKNRKILMFSLFGLLLLGIMLLGLRFAPALADEMTPDHYDLVKTNEPNLINDEATETAKQPEAEDESEDQGSTTNTSTPDAAALLHIMLQDFEDKTFFIKQVGCITFTIRSPKSAMALLCPKTIIAMVGILLMKREM